MASPTPLSPEDQERYKKAARDMLRWRSAQTVALFTVILLLLVAWGYAWSERLFLAAMVIPVLVYLISRQMRNHCRLICESISS